MVVPKKRNKFTMCISFNDLNKDYPKDSFLLPNIDHMIDAMDGHGLMSFIDAYSGYNQITIHPEDQVKISLITNFGIYCYYVKPSGLKLFGATYQRLMNKMSECQIDKTIKVYIDDMLVNYLSAGYHLAHLQETLTF